MSYSLHPYLKSGAHIGLLLVFFLAIFFPCLSSEFAYISIAALVVSFIFICGKRMFYFICTALIVGALCAAFPFLAPVAWILMLVMFFYRIGFIKDNIYAVLAGFYLYGAVIGAILVGSGLKWALPFNPLITSAVIAFLATFILNHIMISLYKRRYTPASAVNIMVSCPLLIILLLLPFVHAIDAFDGGDAGAGDFGDVGHDTVDTDFHVFNSDHVADNPGVHQVHDYFRADGTHVDSYMRTNPDGILENNFSYSGEHHPGLPSDNADTLYHHDVVDAAGHEHSAPYVVTKEKEEKQGKSENSRRDS